MLGGTAEAARLARRLAADRGIATVLSLAGRTKQHAPAPVPQRIGGFGGVEGLAHYLREEGIGAVVDASHPFAERISANAVQACAKTGVPRIAFTRPAWQPGPGDRWTSVADLVAAVRALGPAPRRVFVTTGRLGLAAYRDAPQHDYLVRSIDPPDRADLPPRVRVLLARPPFNLEEEMSLMRNERIEVLVTKNSGGANAKLAAARALEVPVVTVERPEPPPGRVLTELEAVLAWITAHAQRP